MSNEAISGIPSRHQLYHNKMDVTIQSYNDATVAKRATCAHARAHPDKAAMR